MYEHSLILANFPKNTFTNGIFLFPHTHMKQSKLVAAFIPIFKYKKIKLNIAQPLHGFYNVIIIN